MNPIIRRELVGLLRTRKAVALQLGLALALAVLVWVRWPTEGVVDLAGSQSRRVLQVFGYGLLASILLLVPAFPAAALVRERATGTLALLLNSPLKPWSIYFGKLAGVVGFAGVLLLMSLPAAAACYAMGGTSLTGEVLPLYAVLAVAIVQSSALGLLVSSHATSTDSALRITYALVFALAVLTLGPHALLQGQQGPVPTLASWLRCLSPVPAVMEAVGHGEVGAHGIVTELNATARFLILGTASSLLFALLTVRRLNHRLFDRSRPPGVMTEDRSTGGRLGRRLLFLVDPQRRAGLISDWTNPVMVKEFRCRRFGRSHWMLRLIALGAVGSLALSYAAVSGVMGWGVPTIGGLMVVLQIALLILLTPSLAAGLISGEREGGGWQLLQMTPLSAGVILRGKLLSVAWPLLLVLGATLPGYLVMIALEPALVPQVRNVLACLVLMAVFSVLLSAAVSSLFRNTAAATTTAYVILLVLCAGTLLIWLGRDAPFGHDFVQAALSVNPLAAALHAAETPGFAEYRLIPANWWLLGAASLALLGFLVFRIWQLTRPQ